MSLIWYEQRKNRVFNHTVPLAVYMFSFPDMPAPITAGDLLNMSR